MELDYRAMWEQLYRESAAKSYPANATHLTTWMTDIKIEAETRPLIRDIVTQCALVDLAIYVDSDSGYTTLRLGKSNQMWTFTDLDIEDFKRILIDVITQEINLA